jgi:hypothetical protein
MKHASSQIELDLNPVDRVTNVREMASRAATVLLLLPAAQAMAGCPRAVGPCSAVTSGNVVIYAQCDEDPTKSPMAWHTQRHVALGERFGPFLLPWTAIRALLDLFRDDGWSGPAVEGDAEAERS